MNDKENELSLAKEPEERPLFVDDAEMIFESVMTRPGRYRNAANSKWDSLSVSIQDAENLPVVGASIGYSDHDTRAIAQEELPKHSDTGFRFELLEVAGDLDNFFRYPVLVAAGKDGVVVWMSAVDVAALLPKIPIRVALHVLEDLKRKYQQLYEKTVELHAQTDKDQNGDVLNSAISFDTFPETVQLKALELYQERLELSRIAYGIWLRVVADGDEDQVAEVKRLLMDAFKIPAVFSSSHTISDLSIQTRAVVSEDEVGRYFQSLDASQFFGAEMTVPPSSQLITEVYGYEMTKWARKGLFAELLGLELSEALQKILKEVSTTGENVLDEQSIKKLGGVFRFLAEGILIEIPLERTVLVVQPVWDLIEQIFKEFSLGGELEKIKIELGTYYPELAEKLTGENFL